MVTAVMNRPEQPPAPGFAETEASAVEPAVTPDELLDRRFAAGEDNALREVYERYSSLVYTFCRRALGSDVAADAAQETFVAAWRSREQYDPQRGSVGGWLMGIARFKVIEAMRKRERVPEPVDGGEAPNGAGRTVASNDVDAVVDRMLVADALAQLPERTRTIVEMAFYEDLTHEQISARCAIPLGTVKSDLRRGVARMRHHLSTGRRQHHG